MHAPSSPPDPATLIAWYDRHARVLPWRAPPGVTPDPYRVWLSEVMLQQTTVKAVIPYFHAFTARWPTVRDLAAAPDEAIMAAWAGLGYYSRARKLLECARAVAARPDGAFPQTEAELLTLPGIGPYTAAAIAAIAFQVPAVVVDGNVERVMARVHAVEEPLPAAKPVIKRLAALSTPQARPGDYAQAVMDLGATICTPRKPACALCPWRPACRAVRQGDPERFPMKSAKPERPMRRGAAFVAIRSGREVLLGRRPPKGLLGGMAEIPGSAWTTDGPDLRPTVLPSLAWRARPGVATHGFTHFELEVTVFTAEAPAGTPAPEGLWWHPIDELSAAGLPTVMRRILAHAGMT